MANQRPIHEIRLGKVKAAIWKNETDAGSRFSVSIVRLFKTGEVWDSSTSFGRDELPLVSKVADMAHTWVYQHSERAEGASEKSEEPRGRATTRSKRTSAS